MNQEPDDFPFWMSTIVAIAVGYCSVSVLVYAISNPELTSTQVLLNFWRAVTWNW